MAAGVFLATDVHAQPFILEYKPPAPPRIGTGLSIAVDGSGNPHLAYNRDIDLNGAFRHAFKQGGTWHYGTIVDRGSDFNALSFNGGTLYGSYRDAGDSDARFATFNGSSWTTELVSNVFPDEGRYTSLAFDQAGVPHIAYFEGSGADNAIHAFPIGGGSWLGEVAAGFSEPGRQGLYTSIALSPQDTIFISHVGVGTGGLDRIRLTELSGLDWGSADISPTLAPEGFATAVAVTSTGQPVVAFVAGGGGGASHVLYFASRNGSMVWTITPVDTLAEFGSDLAMHLDNAGQPHIVYRKAPALRHAYLDSVLGWRRETVDAPPLGIGGNLDLAIDASDVLHVGYEVFIQWPTNLETPVRYARGTFGSWTTEPVEGEIQDEGSFLALTTTSTGLVVAAYYDAALGDVQVSRRNGGNNWTDDDIAEVGDVGRFVAMPARTVALNSANVAYFDATNGTLVQRSGTYDVWNQTTVATAPALASLSYADSAGFGRIAYYDSAAGDLFLARLGPSGTSIVPVDQAGDVGRSCRIAVTTDGVTHIVYYDATVGRLRHARFVGGAWTYLNIASGPGIGRTCALAALGTVMGVAYYDAANGDLYSARWTGSGWLTNLVDATNDVGSSCSAVIGDGNVIEIAYYDATAAQLKFAVVTDVGDVARVDVVDTGNVGRPNAIALEPTTRMAQIVYYDASLGFLKYALQVPGGVGVDETPSLGSALIVSPSPARVGGSIRVSLSGGVRRIQHLALYDVRGRELGSSTLAGIGAASVDMRVPTSVSGVLFVKAVADNGRISIGRIPVLR